jgi:hypothetical protein
VPPCDIVVVHLFIGNTPMTVKAKLVPNLVWNPPLVVTVGRGDRPPRLPR